MPQVLGGRGDFFLTHTVYTSTRFTNTAVTYFETKLKSKQTQVITQDKLMQDEYTVKRV